MCRIYLLCGVLLPLLIQSQWFPKTSIGGMSKVKAPAFRYKCTSMPYWSLWSDTNMVNHDLIRAKNRKKDEFYTQFRDIEAEMNAYVEHNPDVFRDKTILLPCDDPEWSNFTKFFAAKFNILGLRKLISTSFAPDSKEYVLGGLFSELEMSSPQFDADLSKTHGKIFILERDVDRDRIVDIDDIRWEYLNGDGDFASEEVTALRDEADFIITNPPFSLFRKFFDWVVESRKQFSIIGSVTSLSYKQVFTEILDNRMWIGPTIHSGNREFEVPKDYTLEGTACRIDETGRKFISVKGVRWLTNIDHGLRHSEMNLMSMADNMRFNRHKDFSEKYPYQQNDNYYAIEVPYTDAIPSDYYGVMGVPLSWLDRYCPEQFEIIGLPENPRSCTNPKVLGLMKPGAEKYDRTYNEGARHFARIFIRRK